MPTSTQKADTEMVPNHHAAYPTFAGVGGLVAALTFSVGRGADADLAMRLVAVGADDDVVDVGCGPGVAVRRAARSGAASVVGVDPASVMLRVARIMTRSRHDRPRVRYLEGAAEQLPLPDSCASVLWSLATVHHWRHLDAGLAEVRRVLRPSGRLLAIERRVGPGAAGHGTHGWTDAQARRFAERCTSAGFTDVAISHHQAGRKPVVAVLARRP
jgi:ubiquinone/menaquinone biosynthesis C-methylase UbiE